MAKYHVKRATRIEDVEGAGLVPGDRVQFRYGDEVCEGTLVIEETYVIRLDRATNSGTTTATLRQDPQGRLRELGALKIS